MSLNDTIEKYFAVREAYDRAKAIATEAEKAMRRHEAKVIDAMLAEKQRSVRREDGTTVTLRKRVSFSSTADNRSAIRAWLIETEGSDHDFVEEVVARDTLSEYLTKKLEEGYSPDDFPEFLNVSDRPGITVKGWNSR